MGIARGSLVRAPTPIQNPTIGSCLATVGAYFFKMDPGSEVSVLGVSGCRTDNDSEGHAAGAKLSFHDRRWKLEGRVRYADFTHDLYVAGQPIEIGQSGTIARLGATYTMTPSLSADIATPSCFRRVPALYKIEADVRAAWSEERYGGIGKRAKKDMRSRYTEVIPSFAPPDLVDLDAPTMLAGDLLQ